MKPIHIVIGSCAECRPLRISHAGLTAPRVLPIVGPSDRYALSARIWSNLAGYNGRRMCLRLEGQYASGGGRRCECDQINLSSDQRLCTFEPDQMVVFGDSSEALSAVSAELMGAIPTTHPHAGEVTEGTMT